MTEKEKKEYLLKEFAEICGVHKDTIRNYVAKGLLRDRRNPANNYRVFDDSDVLRMKALTRSITVREADDQVRKSEGGEA